jgi:hypothetical protein
MRENSHQPEQLHLIQNQKSKVSKEENMERTFDPILVEVIKNELAAITEEMAIAVWKTGRSAMMKTGDFATAM